MLTLVSWLQASSMAAKRPTIEGCTLSRAKCRKVNRLHLATSCGSSEKGGPLPSYRSSPNAKARGAASDPACSDRVLPVASRGRQGGLGSRMAQKGQHI